MSFKEDAVSQTALYDLDPAHWLTAEVAAGTLVRVELLISAVSYCDGTSQYKLALTADGAGPGQFGNAP